MAEINIIKELYKLVSGWNQDGDFYAGCRQPWMEENPFWHCADELKKLIERIENG